MTVWEQPPTSSAHLCKPAVLDGRRQLRWRRGTAVRRAQGALDPMAASACTPVARQSVTLQGVKRLPCI